MSAFELMSTESGVKTARHRATGVLVHSEINPLAEAMTCACKLRESSVAFVFLIGSGLGYLPLALSRLGIHCESVEPYVELRENGCSNNSSALFIADVVQSKEQLQARVAALPKNSHIVIAPYVMALRHTLNSDLADYIALLQVTQQSQRVYAPLIEANEEANKLHLRGMKSFFVGEHKSDKIAVAIGSGPTLSMCIETVKECRSELLLIAASGSVAVLAKHQVTPDWIVALEAREAVIRDLESAANGASVLVFSWTHPNIVKDQRLNCVLADDDDRFETGGGSTGLVAADLAARLTRSSIFLVGMEMSDDAGEYSPGSNRETANAALRAPKFEVMRAAFRHWLCRMSTRTIYQLITPGTSAVSGALPLYPAELLTQVARCRSSMADIGAIAE